MAKEVNIPIKAEGAEQAKAKVDALGKSFEGLGVSVEQAGRKGADGLRGFSGETEKTHSGLSKMMGSLTSWIAGIVSFTTAIRLFTSYITANRDALKEHADVAEKQQQRLSRLQYLGGFFQENPELRREVAAYAEAGGRPFEEVAGAWYNLRSKSGTLSSQQQKAILSEALELGRTDTAMPLEVLVDVFSLYAKKTGERDANRIQNVIQQTITEAGGGGADVAQYMPQFLPIGMAGGLSGAEAAGLWSYVTTQTASPSVATTGLRSVFMGLQGRGTPEGQKRLAGLGISPGMDFMTKINALSGAGLSLADAEQIAGREGADILLSLVRDPAAMRRTVESVVSADRPDVDITRGYIDQLTGQDDFARLEENIRQKKIAIENQKGSNLRSLQWRDYLLETERRMRDAGKPEWDIKARLWFEDWFMGAGDLGPGEFQEVYRPLAERGFEFAPASAAPPVTVNHFHNNTIYNRSEGQASPRVEN
jgi:hypothetical protein